MSDDTNSKQKLSASSVPEYDSEKRATRESIRGTRRSGVDLTHGLGEGPAPRSSGKSTNQNYDPKVVAEQAISALEQYQIQAEDMEPEDKIKEDPLINIQNQEKPDTSIN